MMYRLKRRIFIIKWRIKNRKWCECRHKRRALERELRSCGYDY